MTDSFYSDAVLKQNARFLGLIFRLQRRPYKLRTSQQTYGYEKKNEK